MAVKPIVISIVSDSRKAQAGLKGITGKFLGFGKTVAKVTGGAIAGIAATGLVKGFGRLQGLEQAQAKLRGLGHDADTTKTIMDNALASVKGTSFGLDQAATAAASAAAAGIKAGPEMEKYLKMVGDAAAITGRDFQSMGAIINKVNANTKLSMGEVNQVQDAGIPILAKLAEHYKVSTAEMSKMVSEGKVDAATFNEVLTATVGGAALEMGNTFSGAMGNIQAALGRLGASVLSGVFSKLPGLIGGATASLDKLGPIAEKVGEWLATSLGDAFTRVKAALDSVDRSKVRGFFTRLIGVGQTLFAQVKDDLVPALVGFGEMIARNVTPVIETLAPILADVGTAIATAVVPAVSTVVELFTKYENVLVPIAAGVLAIVAALKTYAAIMKTVAAVKKAFIAVQTALNIVMAMNPIGLVILAIVGLGVALVVAYKKSETFRNIVNKVWGAVKTAAVKVWDWLKALPGKIADLFAAAKDWLIDAGRNIIDGLLGGLKEKWETVKGWFKGITDLIPDIKGPAAKDRRLLTGAGNLVMAGFLDGLKKSSREPLRYLSDYSDRVAQAFNADTTSAIGAFEVHASRSNQMTFNMRLSADAVDQLRRGREIQQDLDAYALAGGRRVAR